MCTGSDSDADNSPRELPVACSRDADRLAGHKPRSNPRWKFEPDWKDRPSPPAFNALGRRITIAILSTIGGGIALVAALRFSGMSPAPGLVMAVAGPWIPIAIGIIVMSRLAARVRAADYSLCMHCLYDLRQVPAETCPECGEAFNLEDVQALWGHALSGIQP